MKKTKVRFHLAGGEHFKHWQVTLPNGVVEYHDPVKVSLYLRDCRLKNRRKTAERIFAGETNKTVCSWVETSEVLVIHEPTIDATGSMVMYNPHIAPFWRDEQGVDIDGIHCTNIFSIGKNLYRLS